MLMLDYKLQKHAVETDLQAGADHKYEVVFLTCPFLIFYFLHSIPSLDLMHTFFQSTQLLWIVFAGLSFALLIQSRSANLGVATGQ